MKPFGLALLALALWLAHATTYAQEMSARAIDRCTRAAVRISVEVSGATSIGSGSIIDERGYVLTNFHVVGHVRHGEHGGPGTFYDAEHVQIATVTSARDTATTRYIGRVVRGDVRLDLALIRIVSNADGTPIAAGTTFPTVTLATTDALQPGASLWAFGFPLGVRTINVTGGHMTGFQMSSPASGDAALVSWIRTDAEFNPGNSGGMLVDRQGRLVAVPTAVVSSGETLEPIELARPVERMPTAWHTALEHGAIDDVVVTGIGDLTTGTDISDRAVGDSGGLDAPEVFYYRVPADRPARITVTPAVPLGLIGPSGDIGREGRGTIPIYERDPSSLTLAVLVERSDDGTPVDFQLHIEQVAPTPPPAYPPGVGGYGAVPYPPSYRSAPYPPGVGAYAPVAAPPVSVHGRVIEARTGTPIAAATVMIARPGVDIAQMLGLVAAGRLSMEQLQGMLVASSATDADGYYTLTNVPRARLSGAATMAGYPSAIITVTIGSSDPAVIEALPIQLSR
jgi:serine protease Do